MTYSNRIRVSKLSLGLIVALAAVPVFAQQTAASLGGRVAADSGQPVAGAQVTIVHVPSATSRTATTDASGRYTARGLRVGGPYTITITKDGQTETLNDVYLSLSEDNSIDAMLGTPDVVTLGRVLAVASAPTVFSSSAMGAGTNVEREQIERLPSIQRNLQDYARLDPRVAQTDKDRGEISVAGQNTRYNRITIDGLTTNDTFGLEANNLPTERQPISIDAIEAVEINVSNYDVTQTGYTGANINAVTKSGTNEFHGSVYGVYRDKDFFRQTDDRGQEYSGFDNERLYGLTLGGPIVKDKLFFFLSYEDFVRESPGVNVDLSQAGKVNGIKQTDIDAVSQIARDVYGLDIGGISAPGTLENSTKELLAKIDWNINDFHRASLRYNKTEQDFVEVRNYFPGRVSFDSHWYTQAKEFETWVGQLYSDWNESFSTELTVGYRDYHSEPQNRTRLPQVQVRPDGSSSRRVYFGTEQFRHANVLDTKTFNAAAIGNLFLNDHEIKFGVDYERNDIYNLFLESSLGNYQFDSLDDFRNGNYSFYQLRTPTNGGLDSAAAELTVENIGYFIQDTWYATPKLTLTYGVRVDVPRIDDRPVFNQAVLDTFGFRNDGTIDGNQLVQPRFGFNYTFGSARPTQLRGGVGLFQGSAASVWLANPFTNNGKTISVYRDFDGSEGFEPNPDAQPQPPGNLLSGGDVDIVDPDLEQPSVWKANLAFDHELPWWSTVFTTELLLTKVNEALNYEHLNLGTPRPSPVDGRNLYWAYDPLTGTYDFSRRGARGNRTAAERQFNDVTRVSGTSEGRGVNLTVGVSKPMIENWSWSLAYSKTYATEVNPLTSSRAISNYDARAVLNQNENVANFSNYAIEDRVIGTLSFKKAFFGDYDTQFALFYEGREGKPFSYVYTNDANGDGGRYDNDLFYIPAGPGDVLFKDPAQEAAFWDFIYSNDYLNTNRGSVADRNGARSPWVNTFDLRVRQELPGFWEGHKSEIVLDIINVGNLINKDWGHVEEYGFPLVRGVADLEGIDPATGKYIYSFDQGDVFGPNRFDTVSRWSAQVTFRYKF